MKFMPFWWFFGIFIAYLIVFNLYLAKIKKGRKNSRIRKNIINFDKTGQGQMGGGSSECILTKILNLNVNNFAEVDRGERERRLSIKSG